MLKAMLLRKAGGAIIRHAATVAAGFLLANGYADAEAAQQIAGALTGAGALGLSIAEKRSALKSLW
ncbi:hypothetical protein SAMN06297129_2454 [Pseudooceanicola antarcticus]|uniref:Uncharacterized protein n=2 Tax=Pseudooceanicola antarcticus TaxID=1247613 RepID=A0A285IY48_9RHOB|nr:hypothetical protein [Pseudooceanicola antarcticus]SNY52969.1 hypothetical protein SAMN06297129_2454 [Pseudooceanicola antarcticus]